MIISHPFLSLLVLQNVVVILRVATEDHVTMKDTALANQNLKANFVISARRDFTTTRFVKVSVFRNLMEEEQMVPQ